MPQSLLDRHGRPLRLGEKLGQGGEGAVYRLLDRPGTAVKVFETPLTADRVRKIDELIRLGTRDPAAVATWPSGLAFDRATRPLGLLLPVVERAKDIHHLYAPGSRRVSFPHADWRFLVHVAGNVARAFASVHALGLVIGDVNTGSILVAADGTVRLIDVDSFQVRLPDGQVLLCQVAVPMFQPAELHGAALNRTVRTVHHDAFGLAVTLFQLLMLGRHPYAGRYAGPGDMPIEEAIVEHRFAYGAYAGSARMSKPPHSVGLDILPRPVANLFEQAFSAAAPSTGRPAAAAWVSALHTLRANLTGCRSNPSHHYPSQLPGCPWCPLEAQSGAVLFGAPQSAPTRGRDVEADKLLARLAKIAPPRPLPAPPEPRDLPAARAEAVAAAGIPTGTRVGYAAAAVLIAGGVALVPAGLVLVLLGVIAAAVGHAALGPRRDPFRMALQKASDETAVALKEFTASNQFPAYRAARGRAEAAQVQLEGLPAMRASRLRQMQANRRTEQFNALLNSRLIEDAHIQGIGAGRAATLAAYGIATAADVIYSNITAVPGFGPSLASRLVAWRQSLESGFVFDASKPIEPAAAARLDKEIAHLQAAALRELKDALSQMAAAVRDEPGRAEAAAVRLRSARVRLAQARADVLAVTGKSPVGS